jgi:hypothetical protein
MSDINGSFQKFFDGSKIRDFSRPFQFNNDLISELNKKPESIVAQLLGEKKNNSEIDNLKEKNRQLNQINIQNTNQIQQLNHINNQNATQIQQLKQINTQNTNKIRALEQQLEAAKQLIAELSEHQPPPPYA